MDRLGLRLPQTTLQCQTGADVAAGANVVASAAGGTIEKDFVLLRGKQAVKVKGSRQNCPGNFDH